MYPSPYMGPRELILAAPLQAVANDGAAFTLTITANEKGLADLSRLRIAASSDAALLNGAMDFTPLLFVQAVTLNGSTLFSRGRGGTGIPGDAHSALAPAPFAGLPVVPLQSGDTLTITCIYGYAGGVGHATAMVPFFPSRFAGQADIAIPSANEVWQSAPAGGIIDNTATAVTVVVDTPGIIDLRRAVVSLNLPPTANVAPYDATHAVNIGGIVQAIVRNDYNMVVGQGAGLEAPSAILSGLRQRNWVDLGRHRVTPGDPVVFTLRIQTGVNGQVGVAFPLYPTEGGGRGGVSIARAC